MTQEDKKMLLKDLCGRLPYGVIVQYPNIFRPSEIIKRRLEEISYSLIGIDEYKININDDGIDIEYVKPYLRPMSSMTEEEKREYKHLIAFSGNPIGSANLIDWLNKKMFAYRTIDDKDDKDMFELGLAIKVTEYNNPYD